jgi:hypothetical protein
VIDRLPEPQLDPAQPWAAERASATPVGVEEVSQLLALGIAPGIRPRSLSELQGWMVDAITGPQASSGRGIVASDSRLSAAGRLHVYRHAYSARLLECLRDDYPALAATLGDSRFDALGREYIARHPSQSFSLNAWGRQMANVCATSAPLEQAAFYAELAALEWALVEVTHAEAAAPLDSSELQRIPSAAWGGIRFVASDALRVLSFRYPVNAHYQAYRSEGVVLPVPAQSPSTTAVYRRELTLWRMDLTPAMTRVLNALLAGETLGQALARIELDGADAEAVAEAERSVMVWFRAWVASSFFARVEVE